MISVPVLWDFRPEKYLGSRQAIGQGGPHATGIVAIDDPGRPGQIQTEPPLGASS